MNEITPAQKYEQLIRKLHHANVWTKYETEAHFFEDTIDTPGGAELIRGHLYMGLAYRKSIDSADENKVKRLSELQFMVHNSDDVNALVQTILNAL